MLKIQRASAGSGKTYALAKEYILNLIAYKTEKGQWILRNEKQMEDALHRILAITFTNKATNEMKQRIIKNLALISKLAHSSPSKELIDSTPYIEEFRKLTKADYASIGKVCETALRIVLNNYSLFNISTIDSFFQEILRIFTYEANINESYRLEIDSTYLNDAALDAAFHELDIHPSKMGISSFWLKTIMNDESRKSQLWNPFNKRNTSRSIYSRLRRALAQLEHEDFKEVKDILYKYYDSEEKIKELSEFYKNLREEADRQRRNHLKEIKDKVTYIENLIEKYGISETQLSKSFLGHLKNLKVLEKEDSFNYKFNKILSDGSVFLKKYRTDSHPIDIVAIELYKLVESWNVPAPDSLYKHWLVYGELLPYMGLILEIRHFLSDVLEHNNMIQLSETGYILKKIIGDDDSPFVFERIGNRIDHYLIDEFQDTSRMQWDIIYPLLAEGMARNKDSFIIGDPKQSIYRFRNADHKLITEVVPRTFPGFKSLGESREENTNWRSHTNIVRFNNFFFNELSKIVNSLSQETGGEGKFLDLYSNVVQQPKNEGNKGYVEIRILEPQEDPEDDETDTGAAAEVGPLIVSLLERGYEPNDIGVLVATNSNGKEVVDALVKFNDAQEDASKKIDFISEESLLIASSPVIDIIIGVLEKIAVPTGKIKINEEAEKDKKYKFIKWPQIKTDYKIFSREHLNLSPGERIMQFVNTGTFEDAIPDLLKELSTPSLSAIVESTVQTFIEPELRESEAIYISAFQDLVTDYSQSHYNDPASFLEWWKSRGIRTALASPEGTKAVQIMTIHKSKGLEFKCVILPFANDFFVPSSQKDEWRWVRPADIEGLTPPPFLPIKTTSVLRGSVHENIYNEFFDQTLTDKLNMYYVAFTRACNELYVFTNKSNRSSNKFIDFIREILIQPNAEESKQISEEMMSISELTISSDQTIISFGTPLDENEINSEKIKSQQKEKESIRKHQQYFSDYEINHRRPRLRSKATRLLPSGASDSETL